MTADLITRVRAGDSEAFVIGGGEIFEQALARTERIYLTAVHARVAGDVRFPVLNPSEWTLIQDEPQAADAKNEHDYSFRVLNRKSSVKRASG